VEHLSTGRRRDRTAPGTDTITVAELIKREPMSPEHQRLADELLKAPDPADTAPPLTSRIAFGTLGVLLLFGATAASAMIVSQPAAAPRPVASAAPIDGVLALRPDLVRDAHWPFAANGGFAAAASSGGTAEEPAAAIERSAANPSAGSHESALNVVTEFYRRLERDPTAAASLVAPELLAGQHAELVRAWEAVESVQPQLLARSDRAVLAEVEAGYPDGHRVVLRQLLTVEPGTNPQIVGAELLSARHVAPR
jgi:hypothetical protein